MTPVDPGGADGAATPDAAERVVQGFVQARAAAASGRIARLQQAVRASPRRRSRTRFAWAMAAGVLLLVGSVVLMLHGHGVHPVATPTLDGAATTAGAWVSAAADRTLIWTDGVRCRLGGGSRVRIGDGVQSRLHVETGHALFDVDPSVRRELPVRADLSAGVAEVLGTRFVLSSNAGLAFAETLRGRVSFASTVLSAGRGMAVIGADQRTAFTTSPWADAGIGIHPDALAVYQSGHWLLERPSAGTAVRLWTAQAGQMAMIVDFGQPADQQATGRTLPDGTVEAIIPANTAAMWQLPGLPSACTVEAQIRMDPKDPIIGVASWTARLPAEQMPAGLRNLPAAWRPSKPLRTIRWSTVIVGWQTADEPIWESLVSDQDGRPLERRLGTGWTPTMGFFAERRSTVQLSSVTLASLTVQR